MKSPRRGFLLAALTITLLIVACLTWAQGSDTPIIITDGSLTIESNGVPWTSYTGVGGTRRHPNAEKRVTAVDVTVNGRTQTVTFAGEQCTVTAQYGNTNITVQTGSNGRGIFINTDFSAFHRGATNNHMAHNDASKHMGAIAVKKAGATAFSGTGNGGSKIVIHYR